MIRNKARLYSAYASDCYLAQKELRDFEQGHAVEDVAVRRGLGGPRLVEGNAVRDGRVGWGPVFGGQFMLD